MAFELKVRGLPRRNDHPFFMYEHIFEQADLVKENLDDPEQVIEASEKLARKDHRTIYLTGSGTSFHSCMAVESTLENLVRKPVKSLPAFEMRNYPPQLVDSKALVIVVSTSGMTKVTLDAAKVAKERGAGLVGVTCNPNSTLYKLGDISIVPACGPEYSLCVTKGYTVSVTALLQLSIEMGEREGNTRLASILRGDLEKLPSRLKHTLDKNEDMVRDLGKKLRDKIDFFISGSGPNFATALESAIKMKETSYVHCEGAETEELIHGPTLTFDKRTVIIPIAISKASYDRSLDLIRGAKITRCTTIGLLSETIEHPTDFFNETIAIPKIHEELSPVCCIAPLQLFSYYLAVEKGANPDLLRLEIPEYAEAASVFFPPGSH